MGQILNLQDQYYSTSAKDQFVWLRKWGEKENLQRGLKMMQRQCQGKFSCNSHTDTKNHMDKKGLQTIAAVTSPHAALSPEIKHWSTTMRTEIPVLIDTEFNFDDKRRGRAIALHLQSKHLELFPLPSHHWWLLNGRIKHQWGTPGYR